VTHPPIGDWWQSLYDDLVADLFLARADPAWLDATAAFLVRRLHLKPGDVVFDQCCGTGEVALALARAGCRVIGVDQSSRYVERARLAAGDSPCEFHAADAITFSLPGRCDAGFNWGTGFGNADDGRNLRMLRGAFETLKPGGRFALDFQHVPRVLRDFQTCLVRRHAGPAGEAVVLRESRVDLAAGELAQTWTFFLPDGRRLVRHSAVRLYLPHALGELMRAAGFVELSYHGGLDGEALDLDSPRCVVVGHVPGG
jgi:SAM-dependent methyltransferase